MDMEKYQLFVDIAETENFTLSGERLGYTQSGVSHIIKSLETEIGFPLFIRSRRGVTLTENGKLLLPGIRELLSSNSKLEQTVNEIKGLNTGSISIGTYSSISINWLPKIIYEFHKDYPDININIREGGIDEIEFWIENNMVDFGFCSQRNDQKFEWIHLKDDPLVAILPKSDAADENDSYPLSDFHEQPFVISATGIDYDVHLALTKAKIEPYINFTSTDDYAIIAMVANKLGISILPQLILQQTKDLITALPLEPYTFRRLGIGIKSITSVSPASDKFISYTKKILKDLP